MGFAVAPNDGNDVDTLIKNADLALYRAKYEGKDAYHFFLRIVLDEARSNAAVSLEIDLRTAINKVEVFRAKFPATLLCCRTKALDRVEALIPFWKSPADRGQIKPEAFIAWPKKPG